MTENISGDMSKSERECEKRDSRPSRDREGAVSRGPARPLPDGRGSETAFHARSETLPEYWPDEGGVQVVRPVWIPWPVAVLLVPLLWLMPKQFGPHFSAVRWPGVIVGHLVWVVYGIGCIVIAAVEPLHGWAAYVLERYPGQEVGALLPAPTLSEVFRSPLALMAWNLAQEIDDVETYALVLAGIVGGDVAVALFGALLMPFVAVGEKTRRLFPRCVKMTLWSTTSLVVLGLAMQMAAVLAEDRTVKELWWTLLVSLYVAWFVWIWIRSGLRYAGPAEGPGWERRRPTCEGCGYVLTGLTASDRCPECGLAVTESLPSGRCPSAFAARSGVLGFLQTLWGALIGRGFYGRLALRGHRSAAVRFAMWVCVLAGAMGFVTFVRVAGTLLPAGDSPMGRLDGRDPLQVVAVLTAGAVFPAVSLIVLVGLAGLLVSWFGVRPMDRYGVVALYWSAWLLPVAIATGAATGVLCWMAESGLLGRTVFMGNFIGAVDGAPLAGMPFGFPLAVLILALIRLARGARRIRFANG